MVAGSITPAAFYKTFGRPRVFATEFLDELSVITRTTAGLTTSRTAFLGRPGLRAGRGAEVWKFSSSLTGFGRRSRLDLFVMPSFPRTISELFSSSLATGGSLIAKIAALPLSGRGCSFCSSSEGVAPTWSFRCMARINSSLLASSARMRYNAGFATIAYGPANFGANFAETPCAADDKIRFLF